VAIFTNAFQSMICVLFRMLRRPSRAPQNVAQTKAVEGLDGFPW